MIKVTPSPWARPPCISPSLVCLQELGVGGRQAPVVWMTHFLLRIGSGCRWKHEAHEGGTGRLWKQNGERGCLQAARRHYSQRAQKFLGKEKSKHERKSHFIPLLYTILRHKFKQQRIGKSLADQQDHHLLWGTHCVLRLPPIDARPPWLCSSADTPSIQTSRMKTPKGHTRIHWREHSTLPPSTATTSSGRREWGPEGCLSSG